MKKEKLERWAELVKSSNYVHNEKLIAGFYGKYRFLSNYFHPGRTYYQGYEFQTSENAYQAAKYFIVNGKWGNKLKFFQTCSNDESKKFWKNKKIDDSKLKLWNEVKPQIMEEIVRQKFNKNINKELHTLLLKTKKAKLEERNWWDDTYWGTNTKGRGKNTLGKILMKIRSEYQK